MIGGAGFVEIIVKNCIPGNELNILFPHKFQHKIGYIERAKLATDYL